MHGKVRVREVGGCDWNPLFSRHLYLILLFLQCHRDAGGSNYTDTSVLALHPCLSPHQRFLRLLCVRCDLRISESPFEGTVSSLHVTSSVIVRWPVLMAGTL